MPLTRFSRRTFPFRIKNKESFITSCSMITFWKVNPKKNRVKKKGSLLKKKKQKEKTKLDLENNNGRIFHLETNPNQKPQRGSWLSLSLFLVKNFCFFFFLFVFLCFPKTKNAKVKKTLSMKGTPKIFLFKEKGFFRFCLCFFFFLS